MPLFLAVKFYTREKINKLLDVAPACAHKKASERDGDRESKWVQRLRCDCVKSFLLNANSGHGVLLYCLLQLLGNSCGKTIAIVYVWYERAFVKCYLASVYNMCYVWSPFLDFALNIASASFCRRRALNARTNDNNRNENELNERVNMSAIKNPVTYFHETTKKRTTTEKKNHRQKLLEIQ